MRKDGNERAQVAVAEKFRRLFLLPPKKRNLERWIVCARKSPQQQFGQILCVCVCE